MNATGLNLQQLESILEFQSEGIIYQRADGRIIFFNKAAQQIFGLSEKEAYGRSSTSHDWHLVHEDGSPCPGEEHPSMITLRTGRALNEQILGIARPGQPVTWISINTRPVIRADQEMPEAVIISFSDITHKKLSEDRLRQSERRLNLSLEAANVGLWDMNLQDLTVYFSPTWFGMLGYVPDELPSSFNTWKDLLHPDDRERALERASETISGVREDYEQSFRVRTKSGDFRWIRSTGKVMTWDAQGNPLHMLGTHMDITDLKQAESQANEAKMALESTLNALPDLMFEVDREGRRYDYFAPNRSLLFREPEQFLGKTVKETLPAEAAEIIMQAIEEAAVQGSHLGAVYSLDMPTGRKWFELAISAKGDISDPQCRFIILARDVTQRQQAEESLRRIQWMLSPDTTPDIPGESYKPSYGDLVQLNQSRLILDSVGQKTLNSIAMDYLSMLGTSSAVYESNGDYALGIFSSGWCRFMDQASRKLCGNVDNQEALESGKWLCHESCWTQASKRALETGEPVDIACAGGLRLYALPVLAGGKFVGAINFGYGDPPTDPKTLRDLAELFQVDQDELSDLAGSYESRPPFIFELAKRRLASAASLIGEIVERKQAEEALRRANRELKALWSVSTLQDASFKEISDHILSSLVSMTDSAYGFYGFMDDEEKTMAIHSWSGQAMADCSAVDQPVHFPIGQAGVWGEAVRRREPLMINDYSAGHPKMKGMPEGHLELKKLLVVPFFSQGRIVSLAAVANRERDYDAEDVAQIDSFLSSVQAVIERQLAERTLSESEERFNLALEAVQDAVWDWRVDTGEVYFNPRWYTMLGYEHLELPQAFETWRSLLHPDDLPGAEQVIEKHLQSGDPFEMEFRMRTKEDAWIWILARGKTVERDAQGKPQRMLGTHVDIDWRKRAEDEKSFLKAQLAKAQKMDALGTLASGIAHDFNNLLAAIMGYSELIHDELPDNSTCRADMAEITKAAAKAKTLVRRILTFSRESHSIRKAISIDEVLRDASSILSRTIPKMISMELDIDQNLVPIKADPQQMEQILLNLVTNAADAIEGQGSITIAARNVVADNRRCDVCGNTFSGRYVLLSVKDTGSGMNPETKVRIFDPFFTTKEVGKGTGLGLATVFGIVTSHEGHISCLTEEGKGTEFQIYLPVATAEIVQTDANKLGQDAPLQGDETIMVVDDEAVVRDIAERILTRNGYKVLLASSGEEALAVYREHLGSINGVIMDLGMPGMGGKACLPRILGLDPRAKVLIASGYIQYELTDELQKLGAKGMIAKPFRKADLLQGVRSMLNGKTAD